MSAKQMNQAKAQANGVQVADGTARSRVMEIQRARILRATVHEVGEQGAANVAVIDIVARAGISRRTFYEIFDGCEDCFLAAFDDAVERVGQRVRDAAAGEGSWRERTRAGLATLLAFFEEEPHTARLLVVEALSMGGRALAHRQRALARLIDAVDSVRTESARAARAPTLTAEGVVGGIVSVLHARLLPGDNRSTVTLLNPLMAMIVLPYLGSPAAERELSRPVRKAPRDAPARSTKDNPLKALGMRVTYRTARVLTVVASHPGSSNRQIGEASEMADQGQVSKLMARLEKLGLVENTVAATVTRGEPNAWRLTQRGWQVHDALVAEPAR